MRSKSTSRNAQACVHSTSLRTLACCGWYGYFLMVVGLSPCLAQQFVVPRQDILSIYVFRGKDEAAFKRQLESDAKLAVDRIVKVVSIDESQQQKLKLAATGDLSRFYRQLDEVREQTKDLDIQKQGDQQKIWPLMSPIRQRIDEGILNESSLFEKVLRSVLTDEQRKVYEAHSRGRELALFKSIVRVTISDMERSLPLTSDQRTKLVELVESKRFPVRADRNSIAQVGWGMLAQLSDSETASFLDEQQQKAFVQMKERVVRQRIGIQW